MAPNQQSGISITNSEAQLNKTLNANVQQIRNMKQTLLTDTAGVATTKKYVDDLVPQSHSRPLVGLNLIDIGYTTLSTHIN
jgi:hypothetical protein